MHLLIFLKEYFLQELLLSGTATNSYKRKPEVVELATKTEEEHIRKLGEEQYARRLKGKPGVVELAKEEENGLILELGRAEYIRRLESTVNCGTYTTAHGLERKDRVQDKLEAADALGRLGAFDALTRLCSSHDAYARECAAEALGKFADASALPLLLLLAETDAEVSVRHKADKAIGQIGLVLRETAELLKKGGTRCAATILEQAVRERSLTRQNAQPRVCLRIGGL